MSQLFLDLFQHSARAHLTSQTMTHKLMQICVRCMFALKSCLSMLRSHFTCVNTRQNTDCVDEDQIIQILQYTHKRQHPASGNAQRARRNIEQPQQHRDISAEVRVMCISGRLCVNIPLQWSQKYNRQSDAQTFIVTSLYVGRIRMRMEMCLEERSQHDDLEHLAQYT